MTEGTPTTTLTESEPLFRADPAHVDVEQTLPNGGMCDVHGEAVGHDLQPGVEAHGDLVVLHGRVTNGGWGPPCAAAIAALDGRVGTYANCIANANEAYQKRVVEKQRKAKPTEDDKRRLKHGVDYLRSVVLTPGAIQNVLETHCDIHALKSGKWSKQRFDTGLEKLLGGTTFKYEHKAMVKNEVLSGAALDKPPRLLIQDGDEGQIMALAVVGVMEHVLFKHYEIFSIKHRPKHEAMEFVAKQCAGRGPPCFLLEGDGSAWDTTCGAFIRNAVENPLLKHVGSILARLRFAPEAWIDAHQASCEAAKAKIKPPRGGRGLGGLTRSFAAWMEMFRRSGHRGTSVLNWLLNFVVWACALSAEPRQFMDVGRYRYKCRWTGMDLLRYINCEGDDSILRLALALLTHLPAITAFWERLGFNMKLIVRNGTPAEFCGWLFATKEGLGATGVITPDVARAVGKLAWTTSPCIVGALRSRDYEGARAKLPGVAKATFYALANTHAGYNDPLAMFALRLAEGIDGDLILDDETRYKLGATAEDDELSIAERVAMRINSVDPTVPEEIMRARGYKYSESFLGWLHSPIPWMTPITCSPLERIGGDE